MYILYGIITFLALLYSLFPHNYWSSNSIYIVIIISFFCNYSYYFTIKKNNKINKYIIGFIYLFIYSILFIYIDSLSFERENQKYLNEREIYETSLNYLKK